MKIISEPNSSVPLQNMEDGQIAVITAWPDHEVEGRIVQKSGRSLILIGLPLASHGLLFSSNLLDKDESRRVRILNPGTMIEL